MGGGWDEKRGLRASARQYIYMDNNGRMHISLAGRVDPLTLREREGETQRKRERGC